MATTEKNFWDLPPLSDEDQRLLQAYVQVGRPVDQLPYTADFEELIKILGRKKTQQVMHDVFQRLLLLRKKGRLPRVGDSPAELL